MFVLSNTFDCTARDYIGSLGVSIFCCIGLLGQFTCFFADQNVVGIMGWFYIATALVISCPLIALIRILYHVVVLAKKASQTGEGGWRLLSSQVYQEYFYLLRLDNVDLTLIHPLDSHYTLAVKQELCFLTYTPVFILSILILFIVTWRHDLVLFNLTTSDIIAHDVCMVIYALIATSLPVRIARLERRKARNMIVNAKKNVSHALNAPLRILLSELDLMLGDDSVCSPIQQLLYLIILSYFLIAHLL